MDPFESSIQAQRGRRRQTRLLRAPTGGIALRLGRSTFGVCNPWHQMCASDILTVLCSMLKLLPFQLTTERLSPNSLVFCLSTTQKLYLVPSKDPSTERPLTPEHQNFSDGEIDAVRLTRITKRVPPQVKLDEVEQETRMKSLRETKMKHGAPLADISKCVISCVYGAVS